MGGDAAFRINSCCPRNDPQSLDAGGYFMQNEHFFAVKVFKHRERQSGADIQMADQFLFGNCRTLDFFRQISGGIENVVNRLIAIRLAHFLKVEKGVVGWSVIGKYAQV